MNTQNHVCIFVPSNDDLDRLHHHLTTLPEPLLAPDKQPCTWELHHIETISSENNNPSPCGSFDPSRYFSTLSTRSLGQVLFSTSSTPSTQTVIQENTTKLPDGVVFVADKQYSGKGRGGNVWESPSGCLMFSACCRLSIDGRNLPFVQYLVTLAVVDAVQDIAAEILKPYMSSSAALHKSTASMLANTDNNNNNNNTNTMERLLDIRIKWPNDIYAGNLKIAGVLCHSSYRQNMFHVIMGVGLNVSNTTPTTCIETLLKEKALHLQSFQEKDSDRVEQSLDTSNALDLVVDPPIGPLSKEYLLAKILNRLEPMLYHVAQHGFNGYASQYYSAWMHSGQHVVVECDADGEEGHRDDGMHPHGSRVVICGLSEHGFLLAVDDAGERYELHPDGNSFDFFKGLVRKKL